jgi:hypothetical protein
MAVIITTKDDEGNHRGTPLELVEEILEADPDAVTTLVKGTVSGVQVSDRTAVLYLMQDWTAGGKPKQRKGADGGGSNG